MSKQRVLLFGGSVKADNNLISEALKRKHKVTAVVYDSTKVPFTHPDLCLKNGHMMNKDEVADYAKGHDTVIAVHEPPPINPEEHIKAIKSVIEGTKTAGVRKLMVIGHPVYRSIENTMEFYELWKPIAMAQREALKLFHREQVLNWGYAYSDSLQPDPRTGRLNKQQQMILATPIGEKPIPLKNYVPILLGNALSLTTRLELEMNI